MEGWSDRVSGGSCLIDWFSGAGEGLEASRDQPALRRVKFMMRARELISLLIRCPLPPYLPSSPEGREEAESDLTLVWQQLSVTSL